MVAGLGGGPPARLDGVEPSAWLADALERVVSGRTRADEPEGLLTWTWQAERLAATVGARTL